MRPKSRRTRGVKLLDVITARHVCLELNEMFFAELNAHHLTLDDVSGGDLEEARRLALSMPSTRVMIELKIRYHRNAGHRWTVNDLRDIEALAPAVPYCDIVFTDRAARNNLVHAKLDQMMGTSMPSTTT